MIKNDTYYLQSIWQKYTDVQEQMLRLRSVPISVIPDSAKIVGEKLYLTANENDKTDKIIDEIVSTFKISSKDLNVNIGYFYVKIDDFQRIKEEDKRRLFEKTSTNFIHILPFPVIDGTITSNEDKRLFKVSVVPNPVFFLKNKYPEYVFEHKTLNVKVRNKQLRYYLRITTNRELESSIFKSLNALIGLRKENNSRNTYSYDYWKYINALSHKPFIYDFNTFIQQFIDTCELVKYSEENEIIITVKKNNKIEDIIYDILKINREVFIYDLVYHDYGEYFELMENFLREKFPTIYTKKNDKNGVLHFYQAYQTVEQGRRILHIIEEELKSLKSDTYSFYLFPQMLESSVKYVFDTDSKSKQESQASTVKELRRYDFSVGEITFGKLFRVNYPQMIFDISGDNFELTKHLFESHEISSIVPNLTGDLEKIHRLKSSLNSILNRKNLQNPNLTDFIFDASKAKKIENVYYCISPQSNIFRELDNHLLNTKINLPQKQALIKTLLAEDLALIQGPPGTGKSTAIAEIIWQHIRRDSSERILLTSETNLAVDNAIDRIVNNSHNLVKPIRIGGEEKLEMEGRQFSIDIMKRWTENGTIGVEAEEQNEDEEILPQKLILQNWIENIKRRIDKDNMSDSSIKLWNSFLTEPTKQVRQIFYDHYIKNCNVIGATCSSIGEKNTRNSPTSFFKTYCEIFGSINKGESKKGNQYVNYQGELVFSTVIQDESSKATPAELSLPLIYGKKNIIIGDHRQLPPMLDKEEFKLSLDFLLDKTENKEDIEKIQKLKSFVLKHFDEMEISHFERLFERIDDSLKGVFNLQYRMHPDINEVIKQFYVQDGGLRCGLIEPIDLGVNNPDMSKSASRYHGIEIEGLMSKDTHTIWIDTNSPELLDGTSRVNYGEIEAIRWVLTKFRYSDSFKQYQSFWDNPEDQQIGLISFYGKQIKLLRDLRNEFRDIPIRVSTVDRFQGMERNIIIVSMVRSNRIAIDKEQKADVNLYGELGFPEQKDFGFAQSSNRLNVALSRAKRLLIIVGNSELFRQKDIYNNVYETIAENPNSRIVKYETL